ncbi:NADP-dependent oxidoreductase [Chitinophaga oryzae]|uniref:NADP-dependent oxidoreductase n=1 Tax=Chitinophaga oryzae TaxID=2725414 RepID=A0AAE7DAQ0_9BACT|nr:NADP-dependent oxidoreductase [Chitinophaga oryzae]
MKAMQYKAYGAPEAVLEMVHVSKPGPSHGEIRVKVRAAGVNPSDWKRMEGQYKGFEEVIFPSGVGVEASGIVDAIGDGVTGVRVGDAVFGYGNSTMAEYTLLSDWVQKPEGVPFEVAAAIPVVSETAWRCLDDLNAAPGSTILVSGAAGGIGSAVVQLARRRGLQVIGTASLHNHDYLRALGATPTTYGDGLKDRVQALAPDGIAGALDIAGSGIMPELIDIVGDASMVVSVTDFSAVDYGARFSAGPPRKVHQVLSEVAGLYEKGLYQLYIQAVFPLEEAARALTISSQQQVRGKLVIVVN